MCEFYGTPKQAVIKTRTAFKAFTFHAPDKTNPAFKFMAYAHHVWCG